jgi:hypothetical protein
MGRRPVHPRRRPHSRLSELAAKERFRENWTVVGTVRLGEDLEESSKEMRRILRRSLLATARGLAK